MEESLLATTNNEETSRLKLVLYTPLVQTYEYVFPNSTVVLLRIACINDYKLVSSVVFLNGSAIHIEEIGGWNAWVQFIAIRKRLNEIKVAEGINDQIFYKFDAVKCNYNGKIYGIYSNQISTSLAAFVGQTCPDSKMRQRIVNQYKAIMNDLQEHQIGIGMHFQTESLRVNIHAKLSKPSIRVDHSFAVRAQGMVTAQYYFGQSFNSYQKDIKQVQDFLKEIFTLKAIKHIETPNTQPEIISKLEEIIKYTVLLADLATIPFSEVLKSNNHSKVLHNPFFLKHLYKHFSIEANLNSAAQLIAYQKQLLIESVKVSPQQIKELDQCILLHSNIKNQQQKFQATSKTYAQSLRKLYYNPLQLPPNEKTTSFVTSSEIEKKINSISPISKFSQCQYHFLKAKQSWLSLNFYRALAHLQKAKTFTNSPKILSTIYLQMGRLWSHLCDNTNAQKYYLSALKLRQQSEGRESIQLLSILQNLIILHSRMFRNQKVIDLQNRCDSIKKRYGNSYIRLLPNLTHSISTQSLFGSVTNALESPTKVSKLISKEDIIKMQIERIPSLAKIWQIAKPFFEKGQKDKRNFFEENESLFEFGQLNQLFCMLKLLCYIQGQDSLSDYEEKRIVKSVMQAQSSNERMYYRFVFLLSYYYEKRNNIKESLRYATIMFNAAVFPLTILNSFRKRMLQLAKKVNDLVCIREIYCDVDWLSNQGMMEELYNSAIFFQKEGSQFLCIKSCNKYIQQIKEYSYSDSNKRRKTIDRSQALMLVMTNQQISLHLFSVAWANIKQLKERKKGDKKELNDLAVYFCLEAYRDNQHSYCLQAFQELMVMQELQKMQEAQRKEVWLAVVGALVKSNKQITQFFPSLMNLYDGIDFSMRETDFAVFVRKIEDISKRKPSWTALYNKLKNNRQILISQGRFWENSITSELEELCCSFFQIDRAKKYNIKFVQSIKQRSDTQLTQLQDLIFDLICKITNTKGKASQPIIFLHVLLFQLTSMTRNIQSRVLLLLWISTWPQEVQNVWNNSLYDSKKDRELHLDQLLYQLIQKEPITCRLQALWWFEGKYKDLLKILSSYKSISESDNPLESDILDFKILFGCYFSSQDNESVLCKSIADKLLNLCDQQFV